MISRLIASAWLMSAAFSLCAQTNTVGGATGRIPAGATLPATCTLGALFFKTDATPGQNIYECAAANTWTQQLNSGVGGASTALDNLAAVSINTAFLFQTGLDLGSATKPARDLYIVGSGTYGTNYIQITGGPTGHRVITVPNVTGTLISSADAGTVTNTMLAGSIDVTTKLTGVLVKGQTPFTTKGDLWVTDGSAMSRLGVGTDGNVLTSDAASTNGVKWAAAGGTGTVTNIGTTGPISGGAITTTGTISCPTCVSSVSPGAGIARFAGSTQVATSSELSGDVTTSGSNVTVLGNIPTGATMAGNLLATAVVSPATPAAGKGRIYIDSTSKNVAVKDDAGVVKHGVQTWTGASNEYANSVAADGTVGHARPTCATLSDSGAGCAMSTTASGDITGTLPAATVVGINGVSLAGLATGILKNTTTTGAPSIAAYTDVTGLWTTCTSGWLKYDGTCTSPAGAGTVTSSGTPLIHQLSVFTTATDITGIAVGATDHPLVGATGADPAFSKWIFTNPSTAATLTAGADNAVYTGPAGTDTLVGRASTDTLTNKTYDTAGSGNVFKVNGTQVSAVTGTGSVVLAAGPTITGHPTVEGVTSTGATGTGNYVFSVSPTITGHPVVEGVTSTGATGTGNFVFSAAPTLTGHPTIEGVTSTGATGTGKLVFDTAPALGAVTAASISTGTSPPASSVCAAGTAGMDCLAEGTTPTGTLLGVAAIWADASHFTHINNNNQDSYVIQTNTLPSAGILHVAGSTAKATSSAVVDADLSGQVGLAHGGTNADLSGTGSSTAFLAQAANHAVSARSIASADLPATITSNTSINGTTIPTSKTLMATDTALAIGQTPLTTKGDVLVTTGSVMNRLPVGTDGTILTADAASTNGVKWAAALGTGTVTSVATSGPLSGGPITTTGTLSCPTCVTAASALTSGALVFGGGSQASTVGDLSGDCTTSGSGAITCTKTQGNSFSNAAIATQVKNAQTATYQVLAADFTNSKTITIASGTFTITLVDTATQPANGRSLTIYNYGSGVVTIARSGQNINGGTASYVLQSGSALSPSFARVFSDGIDYFIAGGFANPMTTAGDMIYAGTTGLPTRMATANNAIHVTSSAGVPSIAAPTAPLAVSSSALTCTTCVTSAAALTNGQLVAGAGSQGSAVTNLTGDVTTSGGVATTVVKVNGKTLTIPIGVAVGDPAGSALATGVLGYIVAPTACTITGWDIVVDAGTATVDVWKIATGTDKPTVTNTITASAKPAIASGTVIHSTTLTGWSTGVNVAANDILGFNLDAVATAKYITVNVQCAI